MSLLFHTLLPYTHRLTNVLSTRIVHIQYSLLCVADVSQSNRNHIYQWFCVCFHLGYHKNGSGDDKKKFRRVFGVFFSCDQNRFLELYEINSNISLDLYFLIFYSPCWIESTA